MTHLSAKKFYLFTMLFGSLFHTAAFAVPETVTMQTQIIKPNGAALEAASVDFRYTTLDSLGACVLYVEQFSAVDMRGSGGMSVHNLGSGTPVFSATGSTFSSVFNNNGVTFSCQSGGTYVPGISDRRRIVIQFNDNSGSGLQTLQGIDVNSVPFSNFAGDSTKLAGHSAADFTLKNSFPDCNTAGKVLTFNGTSFICVSPNAGSGTVTNVASANSYLTVTSATTAPILTVNVGTTANTLAAGDDSRFAAALQKTNNLADLSSVSTARTNLGSTTVGDALFISATPAAARTTLGLGTAALLNSGTAATNLVQLDTGAKISAALLPDIDAALITSGTIDATRLPAAVKLWSDAGSGKINYNGGNVGIGIAAPTSTLHVVGKSLFESTVTDATANYTNLVGSVVAAPSATAATRTYIGSYGEASTSGANPIGTLSGVSGQSSNTSTTISSLAGGNFLSISAVTSAATTTTNSYGVYAKSFIGNLAGTTTGSYGVYGYSSDIFGALTSSYGGYFLADLASTSGQTASAYGVYAEVKSYTSATITNGYGVYAAITPNSGTITNRYGVYIAEVGTGANFYNLYSAGTGKSYFAGNIGLGTKTPAAKLDITDTTTTNSAIIVPRAAAFTGTTVDGMIRYNTSSTLFEFRQNGAWVNFTTVSDGRLKTNVISVTKGLDFVNRLNPVFYDWDRTNPKAKDFADQHQLGFIAQEVEKVLPEVVNEGADSYRSIEYGKIVAVVVAAVKELYQSLIQVDDRVRQLEESNQKKDDEIASLKTRLDQIEKSLSVQK